MVIIVFCFFLLVFLHFSQRQIITKSYLRVSNFDAVQDGPKCCINHCNNVALASTGRNSAIDSWGGSCVMNLMRSKTNSKIVNNGLFIFFRVLRADRREQPAILVGCTLHKFRESDSWNSWRIWAYSINFPASVFQWVANYQIGMHNIGDMQIHISSSEGKICIFIWAVRHFLRFLVLLPIKVFFFSG